MNRDQFIAAVSQRTNSTFITLSGYRNDHNEVADYSVLFNASYENALKRSLMILESKVPGDETEARAKKELMASWEKSLERIKGTPLDEVSDAYIRFEGKDGKPINGVKVHSKTGALYLYGLVVHKRVTSAGSYPHDNRKPLTIAKDNLRNLCPISRFRQFKINQEQLDCVSINNLSLLPPKTSSKK